MSGDPDMGKNLPNTGMNTGGYNCAFCGCYVFNGSLHYCASNTPVVPGNFAPSPTYISYPDPLLIEIRDLLKQLVELMEKQT